MCVGVLVDKLSACAIHAVIAPRIGHCFHGVGTAGIMLTGTTPLNQLHRLQSVLAGLGVDLAREASRVRDTVVLSVTVLFAPIIY